MSHDSNPLMLPGNPPPARPDNDLLNNPKALKKAVRAFGLWDWGISAFSSVILTFVFSTYITSGVATAGITDPAAQELAKAHASSTLSFTQMVASLTIALLAPLLGGLADTGGLRNVFLNIFTIGTAVSVLVLPVIAPDQNLLLTGCILIAVGVVFSELAAVFVNSVLPQISTEENAGSVSGTAWALGYWGSILALGVVLLGFVGVAGIPPLFGIPTEDAWNIRLIPVFTAAWILVFTLPLMLRAPASPKDPTAPKWTPLGGYTQIVRNIKEARREEPTTLWYLIASAIYRDGLGAIFTLAGVIAAASYGFKTEEIIIFGIAANLIAGLGVYLGGKADDLFGPKIVIIGGLLAIIVCGIGILFFDAKPVFWVGGLALSFFVGPIQSASRTLLSRMSKPGRETENFGLYATTGRAFGFLGTFAFGVTAKMFGDARMGIVGILIVMVLGLVAFAPIKLKEAGIGRIQRNRRS